MKKTSKLIKVILVFALIIGAFSFNSSVAAAQDVEINETKCILEKYNLDCTRNGLG